MWHRRMHASPTHPPAHQQQVCGLDVTPHIFKARAAPHASQVLQRGAVVQSVQYNHLQGGSLAYRRADRQAGGRTGRQAGGQSDRWAGRQAGRQAGQAAPGHATGGQGRGCVQVAAAKSPRNPRHQNYNSLADVCHYLHLYSQAVVPPQAWLLLTVGSTSPNVSRSQTVWRRLLSSAANAVEKLLQGNALCASLHSCTVCCSSHQHRV
jgi:hypothetical protein